MLTFSTIQLTLSTNRADDEPAISWRQNLFEGTAYTSVGISPLGRAAQPEDITDVVMFYLSDAAKYVSGTVLPVDGGSRAAFQ